ncbi:MAG: Macrocin-O-methyltransferase [Parcubacteria group bacterium GW2011_GWF2_44_17]|nr:MAG: Macrocin-O-methyltransferase [Parcubacteria group bacterium GW2011_GWF2_44_17]
MLPKKWVSACGEFLYRQLPKKQDSLFFLLARVWYTILGDKLNARKMRILGIARPYSMVGRNGLVVTYDLAESLEQKQIQGAFVECGVARGGCSAIMALINAHHKSDRITWLFDSFEGLPKPTAEDEFNPAEFTPPGDRHSSDVQEGCCLGTYEEVSALMFSKLKFATDRVRLVRGWFQSTLHREKNNIGKIAFLRIDGDWYESTKCCLENLYDALAPDGYVYIDDYNSCIGCKKAADEFMQKRGIQAKLISDRRGGAYFLKSS